MNSCYPCTQKSECFMVKASQILKRVIITGNLDNMFKTCVLLLRICDSRILYIYIYSDIRSNKAHVFLFTVISFI